MKRQKIFFLAAAAASGKSLLPQELKNLTKGEKDKAPEAGIEKIRQTGASNEDL